MAYNWYHILVIASQKHHNFRDDVHIDLQIPGLFSKGDPSLTPTTGDADESDTRRAVLISRFGWMLYVPYLCIVSGACHLSAAPCQFQYVCCE